MPGYKKEEEEAKNALNAVDVRVVDATEKGGSLFSTGAATAALLFALNKSCKKRKKSRKTRRRRRK